MTIRNLDFMMAPASVVLVGASEREHSVGRQLALNLIGDGFAGPIHLVNPRGGSLAGRTFHRSLGELPAPADLAVIAAPPPSVPGLIAELAAMGTRSAVVITAGFDRDQRQAMLDAARPALMRLLGPNCIGLMVPGIGLNASFSHIPAPKGDLAFVSQSGALITGILDWAASRRIGFSHVVSLGDMADVDFGDLIDYLAGDTRSRAILLYMEALTAVPKFMSAARRAARVKPVIVVKSGRHAEGARAAASHTGALAGSDAAYDAVFERAGLLRVVELDDLFNAAETLSRLPHLMGDRLAVVTNGGGAGVLAADRIADLGGRLATLAPGTMAALDRALPATWSKGDPVDIIGDAGPERYRSALEAVLSDPGVDAVLVVNCPTAIASSEEAAAAVIATIKARAVSGQPKPIVACWLGDSAARSSRVLFAESGIPSFATPENAIEGFMQLVRHARAQDQLMATPAVVDGEESEDGDKVRAIIEQALGEGRTMLGEDEAKSVLSAYGIPTVPTEVARSPAEVETIARRLLAGEAAVAVKILSPDISHKSDAGGVRLDLVTAEGARIAAEEMVSRISRTLPKARLHGFVVEPMVRRPGAHELIAGMTVDPTVGPALLFGAGGTAVEVVADTRLALPPLDMGLARAQMEHTRVMRLLKGYRDRPPADLDAIAATLVRLGRLVCDHPEIRELDINPLLADATGVIALDARIRLADEAREPRPPMALRPYPSNWVRRAELPGIGEFLIRPIRPEDEPLYAGFFADVTSEDMRMRFFTPAPGLTHRHLARLTQIDYAREMAFAAIAATGELIGVVRLIADPDYTHAEYGVLLRSSLKGRGLGWMLMQHLIAYARAEGLEELKGSVLAENVTMLRMCRELGFKVESVPDEPTLRQVVLSLAAPPVSA
ncbi:MAG: bifunctional acetate--CoA ligase family protein/GNAT family N-acetyltransferase [Hyphomicrobiaceae bacterium]